jgi:glycosyltransferase involved in cell wall biosynthesis
MKLLHTVEFYHPHVGGAEQVVRQISERLAKRGHEVIVATTADAARQTPEVDGVRVESFHVTGNAVRGMTGEKDRYVQFVRNCGADLMLNYAAQSWPTDALLPELTSLPFAKVLAPCGYSALHRPEYRLYFEELATRLQSYDALVYHAANYQDKQFGDDHGLAALAHVIPNGAAEEEFSRKPLGFRQRYRINTRFMLLCVANHYRAKGHDLVIHAFRQLNRADATLVVIGQPAVNGPAKWWRGCYGKCLGARLLQPRMKVLSGVPREWVVSAFQEADIFVFGSQVECAPLVLVEALASQTPFVSTRVGNVAVFERFGRLVDTAQQMAEALDELMRDGAERQRLALAGFAAWKAHYTWEKIADQYERLYSQLVAAKAKR